MRMSSRAPTTPPTTPPAIAPTWGFEEWKEVEEEVEVVGATALVDVGMPADESGAPR